jgi:hypothetical protein
MRCPPSYPVTRLGYLLILRSCPSIHGHGDGYGGAKRTLEEESIGFNERGTNGRDRVMMEVLRWRRNNLLH